METIRKKISQNLIEYGCCFSIFVCITFWILLFNNGTDIMTTCIVRYFIGLLGWIIIKQYFFVEKKKLNIKLILSSIVAVIILGGISVLVNLILVKTNVLTGFSKRYMLLFFLIGLVIYIVVLYHRNRVDENFTLAAIIFLTGTAYAFSLPAVTGLSWDDQIHYQRVIQISQLGNSRMSVAEEEIMKQAYEPEHFEMIGSGEYSDFFHKLNKAYKKNKKVTMPYLDMTLGVTIAYLPSACMMLLGKGLSLPLQLVVILGRWGNVIFYSLIIYLSLKRLKSGKLIIFAVSMFPTTIFLMSNYSYDTWGIALVIYAYSYYWGIMQDEKSRMGYREILIICILFILGFSAKPIYFCMALLPLFVKKEKLKENVSIIKYRLIVIANSIFILLTFICPFLLNGSGGNDIRGGSGVDSFGQVVYILTHPVDYTKTLLSFLGRYWSYAESWKYINSVAYLDGAIMYKSILLVIIALAVIILLDRNTEDFYSITWMNRIWTILLVFASSAFVATSLYVAYTPVGADSIAGCQGRYLLPVLPAVYYYIGGFRFEKKLGSYVNRKMLVTLISGFFYIYTIIVLFQNGMTLYGS